MMRLTWAETTKRSAHEADQAYGDGSHLPRSHLCTSSKGRRQMANIVSGDLISIIYTHMYDEQTIMLTSHYLVSNQTGTVSMANGTANIALETQTFGGVYDQLIDVYNLDVSAGLITVQDIFPARYVRFQYTPTFRDGRQSGGSVSMPSNVAAAITLKADEAGPSNRGTKHIAGLADNYIDAGTLTTTALSAYGNLGAALINNITVTAGAGSFTLRPIIFHKAEPTLLTLVTSYSVGQTSRTERRRTVGRGI